MTLEQIELIIGFIVVIVELFLVSLGVFSQLLESKEIKREVHSIKRMLTGNYVNKL